MLDTDQYVIAQVTHKKIEYLSWDSMGWPEVTPNITAVTSKALALSWLEIARAELLPSARIYKLALVS